jgi:bifunctional DNA-binding transcriptional regulator/antitoxin component of YhaV-PrlF toxin-antitoxin module
MTTTLTVTAKGQVTLRKEVLRHLDVTPGQKVEVDLLPNGRLEVRAARPTGSIEDFIGCAQRPGTKPLAIEEIGEIAAQGWAGLR